VAARRLRVHDDGDMAQLAMKQSIDEITDYLAVIDAKVDAVLRAQTDAVVADMIAGGARH
jgi:hypothetical protein